MKINAIEAMPPPRRRRSWLEIGMLGCSLLATSTTKAGRSFNIAGAQLVPRGDMYFSRTYCIKYTSVSGSGKNKGSLGQMISRHKQYNSAMTNASQTLLCSRDHGLLKCSGILALAGLRAHLHAHPHAAYISANLHSFSVPSLGAICVLHTYPCPLSQLKTLCSRSFCICLAYGTPRHLGC